jgi:transcriptional regulator with XRE-family HTH domain
MKSLLRQARERAGQTIVEVCKAVSVDPGNLSRVENGKQKPSTELAEKLARHFGEPLTEMQILYPERFSLISLDRVSAIQSKPAGAASS